MDTKERRRYSNVVSNRRRYGDNVMTRHAASYYGVCLFISLLMLVSRTVESASSKLLPCDDGRQTIGGNETGGDGRVTVHIAVIVSYTSRLFSINKTKAAIEYAIEEAERMVDRRLRFEVMQYADSKCDSTAAPIAAFNLFTQGKVKAIFGPVCDYSLAPVARYATVWNLPVISPGGMAHDFADKEVEYRMLTRMSSVTFDSLSRFMGQFVETLGWDAVSLLYNSHGLDEIVNRFCYLAMNPIHNELENRHVDVQIHVFHPDVTEETVTGEEKERAWQEYIETMLIERVGRERGVVILCESPDIVRQIVLKAAEMGFNNGEYVFINLNLFNTQKELEKQWYRPDDPHNDAARHAYEMVMTLSVRMPANDEYANFSRRVKERTIREFGNNVYGPNEEANIFVGLFHDAILLYAHAANETLRDGESLSDGEAVIRRMWNRTFTGITGQIHINENGDRKVFYSLLHMNPDTGNFEVVTDYKDVNSIHFVGGYGAVPSSVPTCGYDGENCRTEGLFPPFLIAVIVVLVVLLVGVLLTSLCLYRHYKLEAELSEVNWRIRWDDIMFGAVEKKRPGDRPGGSRLSLRRTSLQSDATDSIVPFHQNDILRQVFTKTGFYKGAVVAIKKIDKPNVTVNRTALFEIKMMRDLHCDHLVRLIGVCVDPPNQCIVTEYCPKGSLQDVLENDQIKLDDMFRFSLMQDIVRGMTYLHSSEIRSHGNLKSSNCLIDSRFVLKITDFGMHSIRSHEDDIRDDDPYAFYRGLLWTAPELLRLQNRLPEGTVKGDVYSFAIICQEIIYRNGPFWVENADVSPKDIYRKVKTGQRPYFRPTLHNSDEAGLDDELANMVRKCWSEDALERPDFPALKTIIRKINKDGDSGNILDNLLLRMEHYANNLEVLVEERTADYLEQKKRAEDLLYMMLPRSVAEKLMKGQLVAAEKFESVTIYFSDICGFTSMSAQSTPMEVVNFLNDLYTTFDMIIDRYDVYKVETIGDAYMVVSGLPTRIEAHASEIARMALAILGAVKSFKVKHRPQDQLMIRIGLHSGPVCAGIVGSKMPRYCLFGDTVNTASRMESTGEPLKIHVSPQTKQLLDGTNGFDLLLRGPVDMKGKGTIVTWWLIGERNSILPPDDRVPAWDLGPSASA